MMDPLNKPIHQPVTVSVARKVVPGKEREYEEWIKGITKVSSGFDGHMGVNVIRPGESPGGEYVIIYRYDSYQNACKWERSAERAAWLVKIEPLVEGEAKRKKVTGLEFWFDLPSVKNTQVPSKHKMALVLFIVVYLLVLTLSSLFQPIIGSYPVWLKLLVVIPSQVVLMTYVVMPRVTALLKNWLYHSVAQG